MKTMVPGEPIFFRLKDPHYSMVGYGFFAHFAVLGLLEAWTTFGEKNGDPDLLRFLVRIGEYRGVDLHILEVHRLPLAARSSGTLSSGLPADGFPGEPIRAGRRTSCAARRRPTRYAPSSFSRRSGSMSAS
jgi:hypothetical protein